MFSSEVDHAWQVVLGRKRLSKIAKKPELQLHSKLHDAGVNGQSADYAERAWAGDIR